MAAISVSEIIALILGVGGPVIGYVIASRSKAKIDRDDAIAERAEINAKMVIFTELLAELRADNRQLFEAARKQLDERAQQNVTATKEATAQAKAAYIEANTVNKKIASIGMSMNDGSPPNPNEPSEGHVLTGTVTGVVHEK